MNNNYKAIYPNALPKASNRNHAKSLQQQVLTRSHLNESILTKQKQEQQSKKIQKMIFNMLDQKNQPSVSFSLNKHELKNQISSNNIFILSPSFLSKSQAKTNNQNNIYEQSYNQYNQQLSIKPVKLISNGPTKKTKKNNQLPLISIKKLSVNSAQQVYNNYSQIQKKILVNDNQIDLFKYKLHKQSNFNKNTPKKSQKYTNGDDLQENIQQKISYSISKSNKSKTPYQLEMENKKKLLQQIRNKNIKLEMNETLNKFLYLRNILQNNKAQKKQNIVQYEKNKQEQIPGQQAKIQQNSNNNDGRLNNNKLSQDNQVAQLNSIKKVYKKNVNQLKYNGDLSVYQLKIRNYRQFIFMMNLTYRLFDPLILKEPGTIKTQDKFRYYLGRGNNSMLIKSLMKRRFWWIQEENQAKSNFTWTQIKLNHIYSIQKKSQIQQKYYKENRQMMYDKEQFKSVIKITDSKNNKAGTYKAPLPTNDMKIFTKYEKHYYSKFLQSGADNPQKYLKFQTRLKFFEEMSLKNLAEDKSGFKVHNHFQLNYFIGNKKALFYNLKQYYQLINKNVYDIIPMTYHIKLGTKDQNYMILSKIFKRKEKEKAKDSKIKNIWIVKPGELSNRGQGITVIDQFYQLDRILKKKEKHFNGVKKTYIVQKYIQKPLLYKNRKFDIRHYMMMSRLHGIMKAYWFGEGYIRTSCYEFKIDQVGDESIHLTNDAIQKHCDAYGKYQEGNKVSYSQFQKYLDSTFGQSKIIFSQHIYPKMRNIALDAVKATYLKMDPSNLQNNFEVFGLDFMIDDQFNVWLIQVNTNPCLQFSSKLLERIIPSMVEQSLRLTLDVLFPPPTHYLNSQKHLCPDNPLQRLQFQLIFDESRDGRQLEQLYRGVKDVDMGEVDQDDDTYQNDGKELPDQIDIE